VDRWRNDLFGRSCLPAATVEELRRELAVAQHLRELHAAAVALATLPGHEIVGQRLLAWFEHGGRLDKALHIVGKRGAHRARPDALIQ
jgi:hypothetical protein